MVGVSVGRYNLALKQWNVLCMTECQGHGKLQFEPVMYSTRDARPSFLTDPYSVCRKLPFENQTFSIFQNHDEKRVIPILYRRKTPSVKILFSQEEKTSIAYQSTSQLLNQCIILII